MSKGKPISRKKDTLLVNVKKVIGDAETFTVEYSPELVDVNVVTNELNQTQNYVPPIAWMVMTGEYQVIAEDVTDGFSAPTNMEN